MWSRRQLLVSLGGAAAVLAVSPRARAAAGEYDVTYLWVDSLGAALDYMARLEAILGDEIGPRLELVRDEAGRYGLVYAPASGGQRAAEALAAEHSALLQDAFDTREPLAAAIPDRGYHRLYNVSYGLGPNLDALRGNYTVVTRVLGAGVAAHLVIERTDSGNYALVYKRYGDMESTRKVASRHARILRGYRMDAAAIQERNNEIVYGSSSRGVEPLPDPSEREAPAQPVAVAPDPTDTPAPSEDGDEDTGLPAVAALTPAPTATPGADLPERATDAPLRSARNSNLRDAINNYIQGQRRAGRVSSNEKTSWMVYDLKNNRTLAGINIDAPRQCASMVKPLVALAFFHEAHRGRIIYGNKSTSKFEQMIQKSSNTATNWAFEQLGGPSRVQSILTKNYGDIFQHTSIVEDIASGGRTYKNRASASDYARFLRALWDDELPHSAELKRLMNLPGRDRLYTGCPNIPVGTEVYNKTGSTSRLCGDMGVLVAPLRRGGRFPYAMIGIVEKSVRASNFGSWIHARGEVIRAVSDLTYRDLQSRFRLR